MPRSTRARTKRDRTSTWNHRIVRREYQGDHVIFAIHEAHYADGVCTGLSTEPTPILSEQLDGIEWTLGGMQRALLLPVLDYETRKEIPSGDPRLAGAVSPPSLIGEPP